MIRTKPALIIASLMLLAAPMAPAIADPASTAPRMTPPSVTLTDISAQQRRERRPARVRIHRESRVLGPQHVRDCDAYYVQEHRPSGTVIVPRMNCFWRHR